MWCNFPWYPLTPSVYYNGMSYYEDICKLAGYINDIIAELSKLDADKITSDVIDAVTEQLNASISDLRSYVDTQDKLLSNKIDNSVNGVYSELEKVKTDLNSKILQVNTELSESIRELESLVKQLNETTYIYIDNRIEFILDYIKNHVADTIKCYNPVNGRYTSVCDAISDVYGNLRYYGITAQQFDSLELTCNDFEGKQLSASQFDLYSLKELYKIPELYMFNPFTGDYVYYQDVIYELASRHYDNPITASEFDGVAGLTCTTFETYNMTAYQFDNNAKSILM